jgi:predicted outer membrane repeat protein
MGTPTDLQAKIIYVKPHGIGNGISWNKASGDLAKVLQNAEKGTEIWVAAGTYKPTKNKNRNQSFTIPNGVKLYGGFKGNEVFLNKRNPLNNLTVLSGEIGDKGIEDNSFNVIYTRNVSEETVIDGFHIISGCAKNWKASQGHRSRSGAGWYNDGSFGESNPTIVNCFFSNNYAIDGGAIYNNGMGGRCEVNINDCSFISNVANADGGAIYNGCQERGVVFFYLKNCVFEGNESNNGAGIFNYNITGIDELKLLNCSFIRNTAFARGSAVFDHSFDTVLVDFKECNFEGNKATLCRKDVYCSLFKEEDKLKKKGKREYRM